MNPPSLAKPVAYSQWLYKRLLVVYPRRHRKEYGREMLQLFRDQCRNAWSAGRWSGLLLLWLRIAPDLLRTSLLEHLANLKFKTIMIKKIFADIICSTSASIALFVVAAMVFLCLMFAVTIVTFIMPEAYASRARISLHDPSQDIVGPSGQKSIGISHLNILAAIDAIQSDAMLDKVIEKLDLNARWQKKYNAERPFKTSDTCVALKRMLKIKPARNTGLIDITAYSDDKNEAAQIANAIAIAIANAYRDYRKTMATTQTNVVAEIVEFAAPGSRPVRPNKPLNIIGGGMISLVIALVAGGVAAAVIGRLNRGVST